MRAMLTMIWPMARNGFTLGLILQRMGRAGS